MQKVKGVGPSGFVLGVGAIIGLSILLDPKEVITLTC
jgi:hypothetical protein